jgi:hypothetical protein
MKIPVLRNTYACLPTLFAELVALRWFMHEVWLAWVTGGSLVLFVAVVYCDLMANHYRAKLGDTSNMPYVA